MLPRVRDGENNLPQTPTTSSCLLHPNERFISSSSSTIRFVTGKLGQRLDGHGFDGQTEFRKYVTDNIDALGVQPLESRDYRRGFRLVLQP